MLNITSNVKPIPGLPVLIPTKPASAPSKSPPVRRASMADLVRGLGKRQLAFLAVDILKGRTKINLLTVDWLSKILGVSKAYIYLAMKASAEDRRLIESGKLSLTGSVKPHQAPTLMSLWDSATPQQQREFVRSRGNQILEAV
jgi:hypothetical protein